MREREREREGEGREKGEAEREGGVRDSIVNIFIHCNK